MESFHSCGNSYLLKQARTVCLLFFPGVSWEQYG